MLRNESWFSLLAKIYGRNFNAVTFINLVVMLVYYLIFVTGTMYVHERFSASLSLAGLTSGIMVIGCLVGRFFCGNILTYTGCKILLIIGLIFYLTTLLVLFHISNLGSFFIDRFFTGFGSGIINTVTATVAAHTIPQKNMGFGISIFSSSTMLGLALGPFTGFTLLDKYGYHFMLYLAVATIVIASLVAFAVKNPSGISHRLRPLLELKSYIDLRVIPFSTVVLIIFLGYGCLQAFMASFAQERNLSDEAGIFFLIYACAAIASRPLAGKKMDSYGENMLIYPLFGIIIIAFIILAFAHSKILFLLSAILFGIGLGNFQSIGQAISLSLVTRRRYAQATSTFFIFMDLGHCCPANAQ